jgi:intracellular sulfur oxidation DsrE/DsrF family protein
MLETLETPLASVPAPAPRRSFLARVGAGALAVVAGGLGASRADARPSRAGAPDQWLGALDGKHKQFFDGVTVNDGFALGFAMNFLNSTGQTLKLTDRELNAVVGLRHFSIPIAFKDEIWAKYKLGEFAKVNDPKTKAPATRNIFYHPQAGDLLFPDMAIDKLQPRGVHFTVCNVALTVLSGMLGGAVGMKAEDAKREWTAGLIPGVVVVPSGVFAVNRAQELGCTYCYAG